MIDFGRLKTNSESDLKRQITDGLPGSRAGHQVLEQYNTNTSELITATEENETDQPMQRHRYETIINERRKQYRTTNLRFTKEPVYIEIGYDEQETFF